VLQARLQFASKLAKLSTFIPPNIPLNILPNLPPNIKKYHPKHPPRFTFQALTFQVIKLFNNPIPCSSPPKGCKHGADVVGTRFLDRSQPLAILAGSKRLLLQGYLLLRLLLLKKMLDSDNSNLLLMCASLA